MNDYPTDCDFREALLGDEKAFEKVVQTRAVKGYVSLVHVGPIPCQCGLKHRPLDEVEVRFLWRKATEKTYELALVNIIKQASTGMASGAMMPCLADIAMVQPMNVLPMDILLHERR